MGFKDYVVLREDVLDPSLDEKLAPEIDDVIFKRAPKIYLDPKEFFERTYLTNTMETILKEIAKVFIDGSGRKVFPITALFGGGKTHTLLTIYHALVNPEATKYLSREIYELYRKISGVKIIVIYGKDSRLAPSPVKPYNGIKTLWGYIAYKLGKYDLVREDDEEIRIPDKSVIHKLLENEKVVILVDEILEYFHTILSINPDMRGYVKQVISFFDLLASEVSNTDNVLVITIAAEPAGGDYRTQSRYSDIKGYISALINALLRTARTLETPVSEKEELYGVLKKRLFKRVDIEKARRELEKLYSTYREYGNIFGDTSDFIEEIKKTYPFHPHYLSILRVISERVTGQRTRFAMRVSRILLRTLYKQSSENPLMIMPWHIDPVGLDLSGLFFRTALDEYGTSIDYTIYKTIYDEEVNGIEENIEKRDLVVAILRTIFLATYPYNKPTPEKVFPTTRDIALMVYEPVLFEKLDCRPPDIINVLQLILTSLPRVRHLHYDSYENRYWFSDVVSVHEWIESEAREILASEREMIEDYVVEETSKLLTSRIIFEEGGLGGRGYRKESLPSTIVVFTENNILAYKNVDSAIDNVSDNSQYKLVALLKCSEDEARRLIYRFRDSERQYANTVVIVTISSDDKRESLINTAARVVASKRVIRKIDELYGKYDKTVRELEKKRAESLKQSYESKLLSDILSFYDIVYYPCIGKSGRTICSTYVSSNNKSISERVIDTLSSEHISKIVKKLGFDTLTEYLKKVNIVIGKGRRVTLSDILGVFKTRPELPMVNDDRIRDAIKEGIIALKIGLIDDFGKLYFKKIYEPSEITTFTGQDQGVTPPYATPSHTIVHWEDALDILIEKIKEDLKRNGEKIKDGIRKIEYYVIHGSQRYRLDALLGKPGWKDILREGFIIRSEKIVKQGIELRVEPKYLEIEPTEKPRIEISIEPLGGYSGVAEITFPTNQREYISRHGDLRGMVPFETWIEIDGSRLSDSTTLTIKAIDENNEVYEEYVNIVLKTRSLVISEPGLLREGDELMRIEIILNKNNYYDLIREIEDLGEWLGRETLIVRRATINIESKNYGSSNLMFIESKPDIVGYIVGELTNTLEEITELEGKIEIEPVEKIRLSSTMVRNLDTRLLSKTELGGKDTIKIHVSRRG